LYGFQSRNINGREIPAPKPVIVDGNSVLKFIDKTSDTFFNTFRRVKFSKSCSKCYLVNEAPYQLIYNENGYVYQYSVYDPERIRVVQQNTQMSDEQVALFLKLPEGLPNSSFQFTGSARAPGIYHVWESNILKKIREGDISIDQLLKFFYNNGNKNRGLKVDLNLHLQRFWNTFYREHQGEFF
jgi:hypothetical protein